MTTITDALQSLCNQIYRFIPQRKPSPDQLKAIKIVAHRGCWNTKERLENTLAAFNECVNHDIWGIEFDIRWTKDNVPVVHHDASTRRVFDKDIQISETLFIELREALPQIPKLEELVHTLGGNLHFMIELKTRCTEEQVSLLKNILSSLTPIEDYHFMSLDFSRFENLNFVSSKAFVSIARTNIKSFYNMTLEKQMGGLTGQYLLLTEAMKKQCHNQNIQVGTGFPTNKNLLYREANRNVNWIFTNKAKDLAAFKS